MRSQPGDVKTISEYQKEEVLMNALDKTISNALMEYELTFGQIIGCLEIVKTEFIRKYWDAPDSAEEKDSSE